MLLRMGHRPGQALAQQHPCHAESHAEEDIGPAQQIPAVLEQGDGLQGKGGEGGKAAADAGLPEELCPLPQPLLGEQAAEEPDGHRPQEIDQQVSSAMEAQSQYETLEEATRATLFWPCRSG